MFCCIHGVLYYSTLHMDSVDDEFEENNQVSLAKKIQENKNMIIMPTELLLKTVVSVCLEQQDTLQMEAVEYKITVSEQSRQMVVSELVPNPIQKVWKVLTSKQQHDLVQGDLFSFDFYEFQIYKFEKKHSIAYSSQLHETNQNCRICFGSETSDNNPLLNFCDCTGSVKYIHLECNQEWIRQAMNKRDQDSFICYTFTNISCGLCKQKWRKKVTHHKKDYYLYDIDMWKSSEPVEQNSDNRLRTVLLAIDNPYFYNEDDFQDGLIIIQIQIQDSVEGRQFPFLLGKSQECQLNISDYVSSEIQCSLIAKNDKLIIRDYGSVFGTHVELKKFKNLAFNAKNGFLMRFTSSIMQFKTKQTIFRYFQPQIDYKVVYSPYKSQNKS